MQFEAIFTAQNITSQRARFAHVIRALQPSVVDEVADLLENVPHTEPYSRIKGAILKRTGKSDEEMFAGIIYKYYYG